MLLAIERNTTVIHPIMLGFFCISVVQVQILKLEAECDKISDLPWRPKRSQIHPKLTFPPLHHHCALLIFSLYAHGRLLVCVGYLTYNTTVVYVAEGALLEANGSHASKSSFTICKLKFLQKLQLSVDDFA